VYRISYGVRKTSRRNTRNLPAKQPLQRSEYQGLARLLQERADELGLSVRALAKRLRRPRTTVHKSLTGQRRLDPIEFLDWCEALDFADPLAVLKPLRRR